MFEKYIQEKGVLTETQFKSVLDNSTSKKNSTFFEALKNASYISEEKLISLACDCYGYERVKDPFKTGVEFDATSKILDLEKAAETKQFAIINNEHLTFIIANPQDDGIKNKIRNELGEEIPFALITSEQFDVFSQYQLKPRINQLRSFDINASIREGERMSAIKRGDMVASAAQKLLDDLVYCALERHASDLHICPLNEDDAMVTLRVDGKVHDYTTIRTSSLENLRNLLKTQAKVGGEDPDIPVEGQIKFKYNGNPIDTRINIVKTRSGYDFALRFIESHLMQLEDLGMSDDNYKKYNNFLRSTKGIVLACGPTGSGKTSLLYAGLQKIRDEKRRIFTMEDPVEIIMPGITQNDIIKEKNISYTARMKTCLRHDPDVIIIGEIRDLEVANEAIQAANTGHLVFSTLHTNDAVGAISRLINMGVEPFALGDALAGVVAQRLVRRVCPNCKETYKLPSNHRWREQYNLGDGQITLARGTGCATCAGTGYHGRMAINEIIITDSEIRDAIQNKLTRAKLEKLLEKRKFVPFLQDGVQKALAGITTFDELDDFRYDVL